MADEEVEQAFFQAPGTESQPANPSIIEHEVADSSDEEYDPSKTLDDHFQAPLSEFQPGQSQIETTTGISNLASTSNADAGPAAEASNPSHNPSSAESQISTPVAPSGTSAQSQTRTIGGFVVEDDDEDDKDEADYEPPAASGMDDTYAMPMTMSEDPSSGNAMQETSPDVSAHPAVQTSASVQDFANSSYIPVSVSNIDPSASGQVQWASHDASVQNSTVVTPVPDSPSASRGRLPHDRVGILQDRIEEDPRGDISAWLELIAEHRSRNRLDSARETYERFFKVFPMAVSLHYFLSFRAQ